MGKTIKINNKRGRRKGDKGKKWTQDDLDFLHAAYLFFSDEELSRILKRAPKTIHSVRRKYGWFKTKKKKQDIQQLCARIPVIFVVSKDEFKENREDLISLLDEKGL